MLDTNVLSAIIRKNPAAVFQLEKAANKARLAISTVTHGELLFGVAKKPGATNTIRIAYEILVRLEILPWDKSVSPIYGQVRAEMEAAGKILGSLDMMIAAHALASGCTLVTADKAFSMVPKLKTVNWEA
jgi:tRNA(fMet)-specific endonuclease VapC